MNAFGRQVRAQIYCDLVTGGFRLEAELTTWLGSHDQRLGFIAPIRAFYDVSINWHAGRMAEDRDRSTPEEAHGSFARHGLTGDFWRLDL